MGTSEGEKTEGQHEQFILPKFSTLVLFSFCSAFYHLRQLRSCCFGGKIPVAGIQTYRDEGTGAYNYLGIWEPAAFQNYYMIGMKAQNDWSQMRGNIEMIRGFTGGMEQIYLRQPLDFQEIYRDQGGFGQRDVAFWRPICPAGFVSLGDVAYACNFCGWPKPIEYISRFRCVSEQLTNRCSHSFAPLWTNEGGFENQQASVWPHSGSRSTFWSANQSWRDVPRNVAYCLKNPIEQGPSTTQRTTQRTTPRWTTRTTPRLVTFNEE